LHLPPPFHASPQRPRPRYSPMSQPAEFALVRWIISVVDAAEGAGGAAPRETPPRGPPRPHKPPRPLRLPRAVSPRRRKPPPRRTLGPPVTARRRARCRCRRLDCQTRCRCKHALCCCCCCCPRRCSCQPRCGRGALWRPPAPQRRHWQRGGALHGAPLRHAVAPRRPQGARRQARGGGGGGSDAGGGDGTGR